MEFLTRSFGTIYRDTIEVIINYINSLCSVGAEHKTADTVLGSNVEFGWRAAAHRNAVEIRYVIDVHISGKNYKSTIRAEFEIDDIAKIRHGYQFDRVGRYECERNEKEP